MVTITDITGKLYDSSFSFKINFDFLSKANKVKKLIATSGGVNTGLHFNLVN